MISQILRASNDVKTDRCIHDIFTYTMSEIGELATEINIRDGYSNKAPGSDGIVGEAIDVIICLVDIIYNVEPDITEADMLEICKLKLQKWQSTQTPRTQHY